MRYHQYKATKHTFIIAITLIEIALITGLSTLNVGNAETFSENSKQRPNITGINTYTKTHADNDGQPLSLTISVVAASFGVAALIQIGLFLLSRKRKKAASRCA
jgi:hypothetical protein